MFVFLSFFRVFFLRFRLTTGSRILLVDHQKKAPTTTTTNHIAERPCRSSWNFSRMLWITNRKKCVERKKVTAKALYDRTGTHSTHATSWCWTFVHCLGRPTLSRPLLFVSARCSAAPPHRARSPLPGRPPLREMEATHWLYLSLFLFLSLDCST